LFKIVAICGVQGWVWNKLKKEAGLFLTTITGSYLALIAADIGRVNGQTSRGIILDVNWWMTYKVYRQ
jgi:hypothetical protein